MRLDGTVSSWIHETNMTLQWIINDWWGSTVLRWTGSVTFWGNLFNIQSNSYLVTHWIVYSCGKYKRYNIIVLKQIVSPNIQCSIRPGGVTTVKGRVEERTPGRRGRPAQLELPRMAKGYPTLHNVQINQTKSWFCLFFKVKKIAVKSGVWKS